MGAINAHHGLLMAAETLTLTQQVQAIFAATGCKGYMLRPDDITTLSANSDGSGAVASVSDPAGRCADLSGLGNHFTQTTSGNRPLWNGQGVDFDGAGDGWTRPSLDLSGATHAYTVFTGQKTTGNNNAPIMVHSTAVSANNGTVGITANGGSVVCFQFNARGVTSLAQSRLNHPSDVLASAVAYWDLSVGTSLDTQLDAWLNGVAQTIGVGANTPPGSLTTQTHYIGSNGSAHFSGKGRRYALIAATAALTTTQLNTLIAWAEEGRV